MLHEIEGDLQGKDLKIAIVASLFNDFVTRSLLSGAQEGLEQNGVVEEAITLVWVPGSFEIALIAKTLAQTGRYDAVVCLGSVIRGETTHYDHVAEETAASISRTSLETNVPIIFGVLTTENRAQALNRAGGEIGNKGYDAALAAIQMARLIRTLKESHSE